LHGALDSRNQDRRRAQLFHAETQQERNERDISCHFSAYAHPDIMGVAGIGDHFEQAQYCRMGRLVKMGDLLVHAIDRKRILNQVVCTNTEKIDLRCKHACADGGARDFDHRANFDFFGRVDFHGA
jgi:hypothetical protein